MITLFLHRFIVCLDLCQSQQNAKVATDTSCFYFTFLICLTFKDCQLIFKPFWGACESSLWEFIIPYEKSHVSSRCLLKMVLTQLPFWFSCIWITRGHRVINAFFPTLTVWQTNLSRLELFVSRVHFRWEAVRAHMGKSDHCINLDVSKRLHVSGPPLLDDTCISAFFKHVVIHE